MMIHVSKFETDLDGKKIRFTYNAQNQLVSKDYGDDGVPDVEFTYTASGQQETVTDQRGVTAFAYDSRDRLTGKHDPVTGTILYTYDLAGNRTSVETPNKGVVSYTFDKLNRMKTVFDPAVGVTEYGYDDVGNRISITNPNGTRTEYSYSSSNRLISVTTTNSFGSETVSSYIYELGPSGNRTAVTEHTGRRVEYGYDSTYKLISEVAAGSPDPSADVDIAYVYDLVGNRLEKTSLSGPVDGDLEPGVTVYSYNANDQMLTESRTADTGVITETLYGYSQSGALVSKVKTVNLLTALPRNLLSMNTTPRTGWPMLKPQRAITPIMWIMYTASRGFVCRAWLFPHISVSDSINIKYTPIANHRWHLL